MSGRIANIVHPKNRTKELRDRAKSLKVGQTTNKNMTKNITANLVHAISHMSNFLIFLFIFFIINLTSFVYYNKIVSFIVDFLIIKFSDDGRSKGARLEIKTERSNQTFSC